MDKKELEVYSEVVNSGIVKMPHRNSPGVVIQGDTLSILFSQAMYLVEELENTGNKDAFFEALDMAEKLEAHINNYEKVLNENGIELPYSREKERTTNVYQHYYDDENT